VARHRPSGTKCGEGFFGTREKGLSVTYVILAIIAALLLAGLWYVRGRRA
jgi:hypothetical protein